MRLWFSSPAPFHVPGGLGKVALSNGSQSDSTLYNPNTHPDEQHPADGSLGGYHAARDRWDEMFADSQQPRSHWQPFHHLLTSTSNRELNQRITSAERQIHDSGVTYN